MNKVTNLRLPPAPAHTCFSADGRKASTQVEMYRHGTLKVGLVGYIRKGVVCVWYKFLGTYGLNREEFSSYVEESGDIECLRAHTAWCMVV